MFKKDTIDIRILAILLCLTLSGHTKAQEIKNIRTPEYLEKGDTIAIVAPAGALKEPEKIIPQAIELAESWGLQVVLGKHLLKKSHHFAGTDAERRSDFQEALDNPSIKAIWCARGGYGSVRILDGLDFTTFKQQPKWIIGYSDITAFHNHIYNLGIETLHAMMPVNLNTDTANTEDLTETIKTLKKALFGKRLRYKIPSSPLNQTGKASGALVGGNISLLASMLGSSSQLSTEGTILFIEDIGEYKYAIDRMLYSLKRAGYFDKVQGIIVGDISNIKRNSTPWGSSIEALVLGIVPKNIPVIFNFPAGHEPDNRALIFGRNTTIKVTKSTAKVVIDKE